MVCEHCAWEADHIQWGDLEEAVGAGHSICKGGTHCTCQHKTGEDLYIKEQRCTVAISATSTQLRSKK